MHVATMNAAPGSAPSAATTARSEGPAAGGWGSGRARALWMGALLVVPALLYAPVLYYSLNSPFHLIDDYAHWRFVLIWESRSSFFSWLEWAAGISDVGLRYRPAWEMYNAVVWKLFGVNAPAHHLTRWILHFGAVAFCCAAFCRICAMSRWATARTAVGCLLPLAVMAHVWLFVPNTPATRLGTQDVLTVFFLGLCNYVAATALSRESQRRTSPTSLRKTRWRGLYALFLLGFLGLTFSKEVNVALSFWFLVAYFVFVCSMTKGGWRAVLAGAPLVAAAVLAVTRVYAATENSGVGYGHAWSAYSSMVNAAKILMGLFQVQSSVVIGAGFVLLLGVLAFGRIAGGLRAPLRALRNARREDGEAGALGRAIAVDYELAFLLFLVGQFIGMFLMLTVSWGVPLRYWYPLVPLLSMLLAFAAKFVLEAAGRRGWPVRRAALPLVAFVVFYVACNYYNFAYQTTTWHGLSNAAGRLIEDMRRLDDRGEHVVVEGTGRHQECSLIQRVGDFFAHFHGMNFTTHVEPPEPPRPYYYVTQQELPNRQKAATISARREYGFLAAAKSVASTLQLRREPFALLDGGMGWWPELGPYAWNIYRLPATDTSWPTPKPCRYRPSTSGSRSLRLRSGWPAARSQAIQRN